MEDQIEQAVAIAIQGAGDPSLRQQAMDFCNQVKSSADGWQMCLSMFTGDRKRSNESRYFALQVIDNSLGNLGPQQLQLVRENLFKYVQAGVVSGSPSSLEDDAAYMRNKIAQTMGYLFIVAYADTWITFFDDILELLPANGSTFGNAIAVDMYLRILKVVHEEIGDNLIIRPLPLLRRNSALKDYIRVRDVNKLANSWAEILGFYTSPANIVTSNANLVNEIIDNCLKVIGGWVSWIEITLIVNPVLLDLIFGLLGNQKQRISACDTISEIILKKMKPSDKLQLIKLLNLTNVVAQLPIENSDIDFDERVAKLCNVIGLELIGILDDTNAANSGEAATPELQQAAENMLLSMFPIILRFLTNEYDDTSSQIFPVISEYLGFVRKESRKEKRKVDTSGLTKDALGQILNFPADINFVPANRLAILPELLNKLIMKAKYDSDTDWVADKDDSDGEFLEIRSRLKLLQDLIAGIEINIYMEGMSSVVNQCLGTGSKNWREVELGLFQLSAFSESLRNGAVNVIKGVQTPANLCLFEMFVKMVNSDAILSINHPAIQLEFMELVVRHASFFTPSESQLLHRVLQVFCSPLGIHNSNSRVQVRSWFLIYRFVKSAKGSIGSIAETVLNSISSLLTIKAELPKKDDDSELSADAAAEEGTFDSQLYLFELCGLIIASVNDVDTQIQLIERILQPIFADTEQGLRQSGGNGGRNTDPLVALQIHHNLMALGTFARGFDDSVPAIVAAKGAIPKKVYDSRLLQEFKNITQVSIVALETLPCIEILRDSSRFAFSRLIPILGTNILDEISRLINALLSECKTTELVDFLGFLGHLVHSYQSERGVFEMLGNMLNGLFTRIFASLDDVDNAGTSGSTDALVMRSDMRKAYLTFLFNIINNNMSAVFMADANKSVYENVLKSVLHYSSDLSDPTSTRQAVLALNKMIQEWGSGQIRPPPPLTEIFGNGLKIEGFEQFLLQVSVLCFEFSSKPGFETGDAQSRIILGEFGSLQKQIYLQKGDSFITYLRGSYLPSVGVPADIIDRYCETLCTVDQKEFKKFFISFISQLTGK
ncbi:Xpo1-domain-containing protein [Nadsonia fulvescens var. elongata DSM 6958]|uniref:Exportin-T n=1 Tax=Nadsonia fulvescens var. elongata DSM 6958 TaxID=857566 RepID=A0A1E3PDK1_9ASCO|nr:Xpo1-domain-containing protein [Nadsonia fulvescens var. elongata DSM 6958]